jgi:hypothetical protein
MSRDRPAAGPRDVARRASQGPSAAGPYRDLCSTCLHAERCGNHSTPEHPILFCEMFEVPASPLPVTRAAAREPADRQDAGDHKGLCMNCENRRTCTLRKPEGGVWHCEEYC